MFKFVYSGSDEGHLIFESGGNLMVQVIEMPVQNSFIIGGNERRTETSPPQRSRSLRPSSEHSPIEYRTALYSFEMAYQAATREVVHSSHFQHKSMHSGSTISLCRQKDVNINM